LFYKYEVQMIKRNTELWFGKRTKYWLYIVKITTGK